MSSTIWTEADTQRALSLWTDYQSAHDLSDREGQTAGIDPETGDIWFGDSAKDIVRQLDERGTRKPLYFVRVGRDYYVRKGGRR